MIENKINKLRETFHSKDINNCFFYIVEKDMTGINIYKGISDISSVSKEILIFAEANYDGKLGQVNIEDLNEERFEEYAQAIIDTALGNDNKTITNNLKHSISPKTLDNLPENSKMMEKILEAEKYAYTKENVFNVYCEIIKTDETIKLIDDEHICEDNNKYLYSAINVQVKKDDISQNMGDFKITKSIDDIDFHPMIDKAVEYGNLLIDANPIKSGNYPIVLSNNVVSQIIAIFLPIFYGENLNNNSSPLKDKLNEIIGIDNFNLIEDPLLENARLSRQFDDEGILVSSKNIVENGKFVNPLYNIKSAKNSKNKENSTGNGFKSNYKSSIGTGVTNVYLEKGNYDLDQLLDMEKGLYIVKTDGMNAGLNIINGDISLLSTGFLIENGEIKNGVNQITIAGNFFDIIKNIEKFGNEYKETPFSMTVNFPSVYAPAIKIKEMTVSGL